MNAGASAPAFIFEIARACPRGGCGSSRDPLQESCTGERASCAETRPWIGGWRAMKPNRLPIELIAAVPRFYDRFLHLHQQSGVHHF